MENISIYNVSELDVAEVLPYVLAFRRLLFPMLDPNKIPQDLQDFEAVFLHNHTGTFLQARNEEGALVGVIGMMEYDYRFPHLNIDVQQTVEVARLFVDPDYRRTGLGSLLFEQLMQIAKQKQIERLYLHTHPFLTGAYEFWLKQGFRLLDYCDESGFPTMHMELMVSELPVINQLQDNILSKELFLMP
ncbi:GNAT family N-acetyltransferase [Sphingobacterium sp. ML3W]|uniref:GNAT family N-acetyltransferase n=1 Tax=Sphingobacterium sp. ML3W TaxID=1538644 RepID=UPI0006897EBA|nr:GNAT family N-acetyltransferase [Sphingobacterium sp. ML3W]